MKDLREDIKKRLTEWSQNRKGYFSDEVLDLHDIVDEEFEKTEYTGQTSAQLWEKQKND
tara:strand:+ start:485 stop:661 length:177 start_codon:yes stop_codon:yes gene_type:complete